MARQEGFDKAIADYSEAIRLDPNEPTTFISRGRAWYAKKEYDKAVADFRRGHQAQSAVERRLLRPRRRLAGYEAVRLGDLRLQRGDSARSGLRARLRFLRNRL